MTRFTVLTLFPEMITGGLMRGVIARAADAGFIAVECVNIRDYAGNKHNRVDDYPYGGGAGMVMMAPPVREAYLAAERAIKERGGSPRLLYMSPQGRPFTQAKARELSREGEIVLLCGRYEGIDERAAELLAPEEVSIGDFILTGGEIAAMAVIDATARLIPGVLGKAESHERESFEGGLLEYPQYTRPPEYMGLAVPEVLVSGDHAAVDRWRRGQSLERTKQRRPELLIGEESRGADAGMQG
ncbi:MAG: tRNA (guanosine(37)-N1)-methyltransferase TrmD [Clostridiales bacterium]|jgi:tRNA (guanine37-N1)-methyltransferase|nr:tRNA (guanosine(37)-N1)-methyltransferase TrmD [Clostridiales bacterium]